MENYSELTPGEKYRIEDAISDIEKAISGLYVDNSMVNAFDEGRKVFVRLSSMTKKLVEILQEQLRSNNIESEVVFMGGVITSFASYDLVIWKNRKETK